MNILKRRRSLETMAMASLTRRLKWSFLMGQSMQSLWSICFVVFLLCGTIYLVIGLRARRVNDGTYIDLSPARQNELIKEWKVKRKDIPQNRLDEVHTTPPPVKSIEVREIVRKTTIPPAKLNPHAGNGKGNVQDVFNLMLPIDSKTGEQAELVGGFAECRLYDLEDESDDEFECLKLDMKPDVTVCIHPVEEDVHVSGHLQRDGMWEEFIVEEFQSILKADPQLGFIDIGAHIGTYSLIAGNMGHEVVAVEPEESSLKRLHKAVKLSNLEDKIIAIRNVISDTRKMVSLKTFKDNHGGTQVSNLEPCFHVRCMPSVKAIHMDDLLEVVHFKKAVIKMDIEGHEHIAFRHSSRFLSKVYVPFILMEWRVLRGYYGSEVTESDDKALAGWLVDYLTNHGYTPYQYTRDIPLITKQWYAWPDDIIWKHEMRDFN